MCHLSPPIQISQNSITALLLILFSQIVTRVAEYNGNWFVNFQSLNTLEFPMADAEDREICIP